MKSSHISASISLSTNLLTHKKPALQINEIQSFNTEESCVNTGKNIKE